jgi:hypothetical protein
MTRNNPETCIITGSGIASTQTVLLVTLLEEASRPPSRVFSIRVFLLLEKIPHRLSKD